MGLTSGYKNQELVLENKKLKSTTLNHVLIPPGVVDDYKENRYFQNKNKKQKRSELFPPFVISDII